MNKYNGKTMIFDSKVDGIPCQVEYEFDMDGKLTYTILDSKGYKAGWLQNKMTEDDQIRIHEEVEEAYQDERDEAMAQMIDIQNGYR